MNTINKFKPPFSKFVKKQSRPFRAEIEDQVKSICTDPHSGEAKIGDLSGMYIHKFSFNRQQYLIAYSFLEHQHSEEHSLDNHLQFEFYKIGTHENFYEDLKNYLRSKR